MAGTLARVVIAPQRVWGAYLANLQRAPRKTKCATSVVAAVLGDAIAQFISHSDERRSDWDYDWARTARLAAFNAGLGVLGHEYYKILDGRVMPHAPKTPAAVAMKVAIDQVLWAPICTSVFYFWKVASEGRPGDYASEVRQKFVPTMLAGYKLWVPAHVINFSLVPTQQRILYANVVSIFGTYILSRAQAGDYSTGAAEEPAAAAAAAGKQGAKKKKQGQAAEEQRRHPTTEVMFDVVMKSE